MRAQRPLLTLALFVALGVPNLYGMMDCGGVGANDFPNITQPVQGEVIAASGLFTANVSFPVALTASSLVEMELQTDSGTTLIDVTSAFVPEGQSDFDGATSASADFDAVALGLVPGFQTLLVRLDADGVGGAAARAVTFEWTGPPSGGSCEETTGSAVNDCFLAVSEATRLCYLATGAACSPTDTTIAAAQSQLSTDVSAACTDAQVQSLGYGAAVTTSGLVARLNESCLGNASTLAARYFGGPHAAVLNGILGNPVGEACLGGAYDESASFLSTAFGLQRDCVLDDGSCVPATVSADIDTEAAISAAAIDANCPGGLLEILVGLPAAEGLARTQSQSECMTSAAHGDTAPLTLRCGPSSLPPGVTVVQTEPAGLTPLAPGVATQLVLDEAVWGTRCGDGTPYAFWVQLAPAGSPVGQMVTHLQGGGVCVLREQCEGVPASLFNALDDNYTESGILSGDPTESAFANWTKLFMPYCTQDVFTGGGVLQDFGTVSVERYGAIDARAALRVLRNIVAAEMNASEPEGFRPDRLQVVFGGSSAGGFGVMFNLHHALDEERWSHSTMINDAALGLDTMGTFGIGTLGSLAQGSWATRLTQPPYCLDS
ncbi:MAG: pectin acetylesterase-family hydrolase, partial [Myxococcota bacterium]